MHRSKTPIKSFLLEENSGVIFAKLVAENDFGLEFRIHDAPAVRVRAPRPTEEHIREMSEFWSGDPMYASADAQPRQILGCKLA